MNLLLGRNGDRSELRTAGAAHALPAAARRDRLDSVERPRRRSRLLLVAAAELLLLLLLLEPQAAIAAAATETATALISQR